jgi:transposase
VTHTNTIEGFWAIMKRAIDGQFQWLGRKCLDLNLNELVWRYCERRNPDRFAGVLHLAVKPRTA